MGVSYNNHKDFDNKTYKILFSTNHSKIDHTSLGNRNMILIRGTKEEREGAGHLIVSYR